MKPSNRIALMFSLSTVLLCGNALAQDGIATHPGAPDAKPVPHHHHKAAAKAVHGVSYDTCVKEKSAAAEYYCSAHSDSCKAEKDGIAEECRGEARGVRHNG